ncbi:hypothetical protein GCM10027451_36570 [Geodermatophilus aquaeductus]
MRQEPVLDGGRLSDHPTGEPRLTRPRHPPPAGPRPPVSVGTDSQRWGRRLVLSLVVVLVSSPLSAAGPTGQMLAVLIGGPAAVLFWVSVIGLLVTAARSWVFRRSSSRTPSQADLRDIVSSDPAPRRPTMAGRRTRVAGAEDSWIKGVRGEHVVGAVLDGTGLPVLHDRRLRKGSRANIDHLVVAADAVYVVDAKNLAGSLTTVGDQLRIGGRDRTALLEGVRRQADEVGAALSRFGITAPVRAVLCLVGTARPPGLGFAGGVLLTTPDTVGQLSTLPGMLAAGDRDRIADLLAWAFPPAVSN